MKNSIAAALLVAASSAAIGATPTSVQKTFKVTLYNQFDYATLTSVPLTVPKTFDLSYAFPLTNIASQDSGPTSISYIFNNVALSSGATPFLMAPPFNSYIVKSTTAFAGVSDYPTSFFEYVAVKTTWSQYFNGQNWSYDLDVRIRKDFAPRAGDGTSDYKPTAQTITDMLADFEHNPSAYTTTFSEYSEVFVPNQNGGGGTYLQGTGISGTIAPVPEPGEWAMIVAGLAVVGGMAQRRRGEAK